MKALSVLFALACFPTIARAGDEAPSGRPSAVLLVVTTTPQGTVATFGQSAGDGGAAGAALARAVEGLGFRVRSAGGQSIAISSEGGGNSLIPVGDQAALDVARKVGAAAAFVVGINVKADGPIRGTHLVGAAGRGQLRLLDVQSGNAVASAEADGGGFDAALDRAAAAASRDITDHLVRAIEGQATSRWPAAAPAGSGSFVAVEIKGAHAWGAVAAIIQRLGATEGVAAVHARDVRRGRILLAVDSKLAARNLAAAVERARLPSGTVRATASGDGKIVVEVRGDTAPPAPPEQP